MTDDGAERLMRETMRDRDGEFGPADVHGLAAGARRRAARRRWYGVAAAAVVTLAVAGGVAFVVGPSRSANVASPPDPSATSTASSYQLPHDWIWRSSRGLQIGVPGGWQLNDYACNMTQAPSFVNGGPGTECLTPETAAKQVAIIAAEPVGDFSGLPTSSVSLDGVEATLTRGTLPDGREAALLAVPQRHVYLSVRTRDEPEVSEILRSARLVDVDYLGCPTHRPAVSADGAPGSGIIGPDPTQVVVCHYPATDDLLQGSANVEDENRTALLDALSTAAPGPNPDLAPKDCLGLPDPPADAVLLVHPSSGPTTRLWVGFSQCTQRHVTNGDVIVHVSDELLHALMAPLRTAYGLLGPLG